MNSDTNKFYANATLCPVPSQIHPNFALQQKMFYKCIVELSKAFFCKKIKMKLLEKLLNKKTFPYLIGVFNDFRIVDDISSLDSESISSCLRFRPRIICVTLPEHDCSGTFRRL